MKKLLGILATLTLASSSATSVIACGVSQQPNINGKKNISTEFTLFNRVGVTATNNIDEKIFNEALKEERISSNLHFNDFTVTDAEHNTAPALPQQPVKGYIVLTANNNPTLEYAGSITIHFSLILLQTIDVTQNVVIPNNQIFRITRYMHNFRPAYQEMWEAVLNNLDPNFPAPPEDFNSYTFAGLEALNTFNVPGGIVITATYNGNSDTADEFFEGVLTIDLTVLSFAASVNPRVVNNNISDDELYDLVWQAVDAFHNNQLLSNISPDRNDYDIDWTGVVVPPIGGQTLVNFLAISKDENVWDSTTVTGTITKDPIQLPTVITLNLPIIVSNAQKFSIDANEVWEKAMAQAGMIVFPALQNFSTVDWNDIFKNNWPSVGANKTITLIALNRNIDPMFVGDVQINGKIINEGLVKSIDIAPIIVNVGLDTKDIIATIWQEIVKNNKLDLRLSNDLKKYILGRETDLENAVRDSVTNNRFEKFSLTLAGAKATVGLDVETILNGSIKAINAPIAGPTAIDIVQQQPVFNVSAVFGNSDIQANLIARQVWGEVLKTNNFMDPNGSLYGVSNFLDDWQNTLVDNIKDKINIGGLAPGQKLTITETLQLKNQAIYNGNLTISFEITSSDRINFGVLDLTGNTIITVINNVPDSLEQIDLIIKRMMFDVWNKLINLNLLPADFPKDITGYNYFADIIKNQFKLVDLPQQDIDFEVLGISLLDPLYVGTIDIKVRVILAF